MTHDIRFVEQTLKAIGDPRHLTGKHCLHTECDFFSWTKGEDNLPVTHDSGLVPRIPLERVYQEFEKYKHELGSWRTALTKGKYEWYLMVNDLLSEYPFSDLISVIYTCKMFLDYFLFGRTILDNDFIDKEQNFKIQKRWKSVKSFMMSENIWKSIPYLYKDITRLYWGISHYRNSLQKSFLDNNLYDENIFKIKLDQVNKITIRCFRSRRTLQAILKSLSTIYISLSRLDDDKATQYYQTKTKEVYDIVQNYIPSNPLEASELLKELEEFIELNSEDKKCLLNTPKIDIHFDYPDQPRLQTCFWINKYNDLIEIPQVLITNRIREQLNMMENKYIKEIKYYEKDLDQWQKSCNRLKEIATSLKPICE